MDAKFGISLSQRVSCRFLSLISVFGRDLTFQKHWIITHDYTNSQLDFSLSGSEFAVPAQWAEWGKWSPCSDLCSEDGTRSRQRACAFGVIGEGSCIEKSGSSSRDEESCGGNCPSTPCSSNIFNLRNQHTVSISQPPAEICFRKR